MIALFKKAGTNFEKRDNIFGNTSLHSVLDFMGKGEPELVKALIESGADVNAFNGDGVTPWLMP